MLPSPLCVDRAVLLDCLIECLGSVPQFLYVVCLRCHFMSVLAIDTQSNKTRQLFPTFFCPKNDFSENIGFLRDNLFLCEGEWSSKHVKND